MRKFEIKREKINKKRKT